MLGAARKHTEDFVFVCAAPLSVLVRRPFEVMLSFPFNGFFHLLGQTGRRERAHQPEGVGPGQRCRAVQDQASHSTPQADERLLRSSCKFPQPLATVLVAYRFVSFQGLSMQVVRFRFDGSPINENDTPTSLEMEEGDTIEVYQQQTGGGGVAH